MNYMGGKHRQGPKIAEIVARYLKPGIEYYEPFCGAMGSATRVVDKMINARGKRLILSDVSEPLINMWKALLSGWIPPDVITEDTYNKIKSIRDKNDPMTAFCGFGITFAGIWFGTYARNKIGTNYAMNAKKSTMRKVSILLMAPVRVEIKDYLDVTPTNAVIYLDPPYANRTKGHDFIKFNNDQFWQYARDLTGSNYVIATCFDIPKGWISIHNFGDTVVRHYTSKGADGTNEHIIMHESQVDERA